MNFISEQQMRTLMEPLRHVAGPEAFARSAAASFGSVFRASKAVFVVRPRVARAALSPDDVHFVNWPAWCKAHYCRHLRLDDPIRRWLAACEGPRSDDVARLSDLVPERQLLHAPYYREMMQPSGVRHVMTVVLRDGPDITGALSLLRDADAPDFDADDRALAQTLSPVLDVAWLIAAERSARQGASDAAAAAAPAFDRFAQLTPREREVMQHVVRGLSNKDIARQLAASPWTVKNHLRAIFRKTEVTSRTALCAAAAPPPSPRA